MTVVEPHLDAMGVIGRLRQDVFDHSAGQFPGTLVFFQYDENLAAGSDVATLRSIHVHLTLYSYCLDLCFQVQYVNPLAKCAPFFLGLKNITAAGSAVPDRILAGGNR